MHGLKLMCMVLPPPGRFWNARSLRAHIYSYMALYELVIEQFFNDNPDLVEVCQEASNEMEDARAVANKSTRPAL